MITFNEKIKIIKESTTEYICKNFNRNILDIKEEIKEITESHTINNHSKNSEGMTENITQQIKEKSTDSSNIIIKQSKQQLINLINNKGR